MFKGEHTHSHGITCHHCLEKVDQNSFEHNEQNDKNIHDMNKSSNIKACKIYQNGYTVQSGCVSVLVGHEKPYSFSVPPGTNLDFVLFKTSAKDKTQKKIFMTTNFILLPWLKYCRVDPTFALQALLLSKYKLTEVEN